MGAEQDERKVVPEQAGVARRRRGWWWWMWRVPVALALFSV